jgi:hypothetical protein
MRNKLSRREALVQFCEIVEHERDAAALGVEHTKALRVLAATVRRLNLLAPRASARRAT